MGSDTQKIYHALSLWANYIETRDVVLSASDAKRYGKEVRALDAGQMKHVIRLRELSELALRGKIKIE